MRARLGRQRGQSFVDAAAQTGASSALRAPAAFSAGVSAAFAFAGSATGSHPSFGLVGAGCGGAYSALLLAQMPPSSARGSAAVPYTRQPDPCRVTPSASACGARLLRSLSPVLRDSGGRREPGGRQLMGGDGSPPGRSRTAGSERSLDAENFAEKGADDSAESAAFSVKQLERVLAKRRSVLSLLLRLAANRAAPDSRAQAPAAAQVLRFIEDVRLVPAAEVVALKKDSRERHCFGPADLRAAGNDCQTEKSLSHVCSDMQRYVRPDDAERHSQRAQWAETTVADGGHDSLARNCPRLPPHQFLGNGFIKPCMRLSPSPVANDGRPGAADGAFFDRSHLSLTLAKTEAI